MLTKERLKEALASFPDGVVSVAVSKGPTLVATVVSESFRNLDEAIRQERIFNHLYEKLSGDDVDAIEFVFTNAPGEDTSEAAA